MGRRENLENYESYLIPRGILSSTTNLGGGGGWAEGDGGSPEKFSMQFTDSKSQQQSPLVAFLATTVLVKTNTFMTYTVISGTVFKATRCNSKLLEHCPGVFGK